MANLTQYERYQVLLEYIDSNFKHQLTTEKIESVCCYSYRNINRIFTAMNNQAIGHYVKRMRIEKAAEYLKYSDKSVADIATSVGYSDTASFSKAFKNSVGSAPTIYREKTMIGREMDSIFDKTIVSEKYSPISFEMVRLTRTDIVFCQYRGSYKYTIGMESLWDKLITFAIGENLLSSDTTYLAEILDDDAITSSLNCRYNAAITLHDDSDFTSVGAFRRKTVLGGDYVKFIHQGSHASSAETYDRIYAQWMLHVGMELDDRETIEIYSNDEATTPESELITEIYIPVIITQ